MADGGRAGNKRKSSSSVNHYKIREQQIAKHWRDLGKPGTLNQFRSSNAGKEWYKGWSGRLQSGGGIGQYLNSGNKEPDNKRQRGDRSPQPGPSSRPDNSVDDSEPNTRSFTPLDFSDFLDDYFMETAGGVQGDAMDVSQDSTEGGVEPMTRGATGARGGNSLGSSQIIQFPHSSMSTNASFKFCKSRFMFSYAYANNQLRDDPYGKDLDWFCTSLAHIPVDFLPFYLTPAEYENLPNNCKVQKVWCKIKVVGVRSAFDVGSTVSGTATSEYCPILHTCIGLNNKCNIQNLRYKATGMVPNSLQKFDCDELIKKWYSYYDSSSQLVPRSSTHYAVQYWNKEAAPISSQYARGYQPHSSGMFRLDKYVNSYLLNSTIGQEILSYEYCPVAGYITTPKVSFTPYALHQGNIDIPENSCKRTHVNFDKTFSIQGQTFQSKYDTCAYHYGQTIEEYDTSSTAGGAAAIRVQPQVHIGLSPIPQLNPETETTSFLNASLYYHVQCGIEITSDSDTEWSNGLPSTHSRNVVFHNYSEKHYSQPQEVFGIALNENGGTLQSASSPIAHRTRSRESNIFKSFL
ncbi:hypothetical protein U1Q18_051352 [Sarracenia purpurea var. burkii]